jgi:hypothetical protein
MLSCAPRPAIDPHNNCQLMPGARVDSLSQALRSAVRSEQKRHMVACGNNSPTRVPFRQAEDHIADHADAADPRDRGLGGVWRQPQQVSVIDVRLRELHRKPSARVLRIGAGGKLRRRNRRNGLFDPDLVVMERRATDGGYGLGPSEHIDATAADMGFVRVH